MIDNQIKTELSDGRILIRRDRAEDATVIYEAVRESIPEVSKWMSWCHADYAIDETRAFLVSQDEGWTSGTAYGFSIFDVVTGVYYGGVGLNHIVREYRYANLGYWVRTGYAGRGIASSATRLMARFGFEELGLQRVEIVAAVGNLASQRAAEKAGAVREGILRKRIVQDGITHDAVIYSLVEEDLAIP
jgi:RimJ/RimL family protein N-acetyltransferase